jgi:hypothetical protein
VTALPKRLNPLSAVSIATEQGNAGLAAELQSNVALYQSGETVARPKSDKWQFVT